MLHTRTHGGPDAQGAPLYDFSTNSNACGPCPQALAAVQAADATRYPDASYTALRAVLADFYAVAPWRIVLAGSASEFIFRITAWARQQGARTVGLPTHAYGDYAHAAQAWGLGVAEASAQADLVWACEPSSPLGQAHSQALGDVLNRADGTVVLDSAYAPLRLSGLPTVDDVQRQQLWQLFSPNKSLGLTGVRAAFAIAPLGAEAAVQQLEALAPSWVLGAHGAALLMAWTHADTQRWLEDSLRTLVGWKQRQTDLLHAAGWTVQPSDTPFFCARPPAAWDTVSLCVALRVHGIKLRDATSFGLPGWVRLGVLPPAAQDALMQQLLYGD
ncbi:aminotransferase class I/II-fold pyridoxal phosphate-dependent enzyme [Rhodoferax sp.]|uniref:aminotransferase class I/II-fold pyridoxal phosphate-dependent enzyme n=1 Tax=Rhodoferax sp. TaxID=50421 RepID=UPI002ACDFC73|nr:aminotransferase class I/II-fold pyridoxal phosphate-dependent enzyme [Rhodoferax sp.]MDZ7918715.1 aminotransferase class I/II-fold pyridoxal phosphate-dependent enzyme [Rhodoferax sp.]